MNYLLVMAGGAVGSLLRYCVSLWMIKLFGALYPIPTFTVNVTGSFLVGLLGTILTQRLDWHPHWRLLLLTGFLGGYTTFSAFEFETYTAVHGKREWTALFYVVASVVMGYVAVMAGALCASVSRRFS